MEPNSNASRPIIHYAFDPLCGWCYGFGPVIASLQAKYAGAIEVRPLVGGMAVGDRAMPLAEGYGYIKGALGDVERATGIRFGDGFRQLLDEGTYYYDSLPPCRAMVAFAAVVADPVAQVAYAERLQRAIFFEGKGLNDLRLLAELAAPEVSPSNDYEAFAEAYASEQNLPETVAAFERAHGYGVRGFPSLVLEVAGQTQVIARGFRPEAELDPLFAHIAERFTTRG